MSTANVLAKNRDHLEQLIRETIKKDGPNCDLNFIDTSNITDMSRLFGDPAFNRDLQEFNGNISKWDVSKVQNMRGMFFDSPFNGDISEWNVSNVNDMQSMFYGTPFNENLSRWDVSNVEYMQGMFFGTPFNGDISNWNVSKVKNMQSMFSASKFNGDIGKWDVSHVQNMSWMFEQSAFNGDISGWKTDHLQDARAMFLNSESERTGKAEKWLKHAYPILLENATDFDGHVIALNREHLLTLIDAAVFLQGPNCDLNFIDVSNVNMMFNLFENSPFNGDISKWDVSNVTDMEEMFFDSALEKSKKLPKWYKE